MMLIPEIFQEYSYLPVMSENKLIQGQVELDDCGYIITDRDQKHKPCRRSAVPVIFVLRI